PLQRGNAARPVAVFQERRGRDPVTQGVIRRGGRCALLNCYPSVRRRLPLDRRGGGGVRGGGGEEDEILWGIRRLGRRFGRLGPGGGGWIQANLELDHVRGESLQRSGRRLCLGGRLEGRGFQPVELDANGLCRRHEFGRTQALQRGLVCHGRRVRL